MENVDFFSLAPLKLAFFSLLLAYRIVLLSSVSNCEPCLGVLRCRPHTSFQITALVIGLQQLRRACRKEGSPDSPEDMEARDWLERAALLKVCLCSSRGKGKISTVMKYTLTKDASILVNCSSHCIKVAEQAPVDISHCM